jgi:hypothetical protein
MAPNQSEALRHIAKVSPALNAIARHCNESHAIALIRIKIDTSVEAAEYQGRSFGVLVDWRPSVILKLTMGRRFDDEACDISSSRGARGSFNSVRLC